MEKEFVPYELAVKLKKLGFDEPCLLHVTHYGEMKETRSSLWMLNGYLAECNDDEKITIDYEFPNHPSNKEEYWQEINIPTFSQAFRWFREKYHLEGEISKRYRWSVNAPNPDETFYQWGIFDFTIGRKNYIVWLAGYDADKGEKACTSYEEAERACLDKLIEIVESQKTK